MAQPRLGPLAAAAALLAGLAGADRAQAQAGSASSTMAVSLEILPNCTLAAAPLAFGAVGGADAPSQSATASIDVACGPGVPFTIALDEGQNPAIGTRRALDPATGEYATYDIFLDPGHSQRWGAGGAQSVSGVTTSAGTARLTAYGMIGSAAELAAGRYSDTVTVTMVF